MDDQTYDEVLAELETLEEAEGLDMNKLLMLSDDLRQSLTWVVKENRFTADELAEHLELDSERTQKLLNVLMLKGFVEFQTDQPGAKYRANVTTTRFIRKYQVPKDIWDLFD